MRAPIISDNMRGKGEPKSIGSSTYIVYLDRDTSLYRAVSSYENELPNIENADFVDLMDETMAAIPIQANHSEGSKILVKRGVYHLSKTWTILRTQDFELDCGATVFNFDPLTGDGIVIDTAISCIFKFGLLVSQTDGTILLLAPTIESGEGTCVAQSFISAVCINGPNATGLRLNPGDGDICGNKFWLNEVNTLSANPTVGIKLDDPIAEHTISENQFFILVHAGIGGIGVSIGDSAIDRINHNQYYGDIMGAGNPLERGIETYGYNDDFYVTLKNYAAGKEVILQDGANGNNFFGQFPLGITNSSGNVTNNFYTQNGVPVDRGDAVAEDWIIGDLTTDGTWRDLDCSAIVPAGVKNIHFQISLVDDAANSLFELRTKGNADVFNVLKQRTQVAAIPVELEGKVPCDDQRVVQYRASNLVWNTINITIKGWEF